MDVSQYDALRHFADSWGLLYMMAIFVAVVAMLLRPGARQSARAAAEIPLRDEDTSGDDRR
jgi:cytochrome c oxidase cbb3-type subunit 4